MKRKINLVGVSGGPDSMALLDMLVKKHFHVAVVHVNYGLRESATRDQLIVQEYCQQHQLECFVFHADLAKEGNFQTKARDYRYACYQQVYQKVNARALYLAHHQDDQVETILFQLLTQRQPAYLGMKPVMRRNQMIVRRPLLKKTKQELEFYCQRNHVNYGIDETNLKPVYTRNRLRQILSTYSENEKKQLLFYQKHYERRNKVIERQTEAYFKKTSGRLRCEDYKLETYSVQLSILREFLRMNEVDVYHMTQKHLLEIHKCLLDGNNHTIELKPNYRLVIEYQQAMIWPSRDYNYAYSLEEIRYFSTPHFKVLHMGPKETGLFVTEQDFPITIRNAQSADKIKLSFGTKRVSRFFIDRKIGREQRRMWPVVENAKKEVIFVYGLGADMTHRKENPNLFVIKY